MATSTSTQPQPRLVLPIGKLPAEELRYSQAYTIYCTVKDYNSLNAQNTKVGVRTEYVHKSSNGSTFKSTVPPGGPKPEMKTGVNGNVKTINTNDPKVQDEAKQKLAWLVNKFPQVGFYQSLRSWSENRPLSYKQIISIFNNYDDKNPQAKAESEKEEQKAWNATPTNPNEPYDPDWVPW